MERDREAMMKRISALEKNVATLERLALENTARHMAQRILNEEKGQEESNGKNEKRVMNEATDVEMMPHDESGRKALE